MGLAGRSWPLWQWDHNEDGGKPTMERFQGIGDIGGEILEDTRDFTLKSPRFPWIFPSILGNGALSHPS